MTPREDEIYAVVREFMQDHGLKPELLVPEADMRDVGINSLHAVDLAFRFEDRFGLDIPLESFPLTTIGEAVRFVAALAAKTEAAAD